MNEIITNHMDTTGFRGYDVYDVRRNKADSIGAFVMPSAPVRISGGGVEWYSKFSLDDQIVLGTGRIVKGDD